MVTNQSGVARGYFTEAFVHEAFDLINQQLAPAQAQLDRLEYCPHHLKGVPPLNIECACRKPHPGMINNTQTALDLDLGALIWQAINAVISNWVKTPE